MATVTQMLGSGWTVGQKTNNRLTANFEYCLVPAPIGRVRYKVAPTSPKTFNHLTSRTALLTVVAMLDLLQIRCCVGSR